MYRIVEWRHLGIAHFLIDSKSHVCITKHVVWYMLHSRSEYRFAKPIRTLLFSVARPKQCQRRLSIECYTSQKTAVVYTLIYYLLVCEIQANINNDLTLFYVFNNKYATNY